MTEVHDHTEAPGHVPADAFAERTAAAENLPLDQRAEAFAALHDELRTRLESGGTTSA
uniref:Uncharacterized protein n=1 Tax=Neobacillus citreus TaxID=2833578 RepID=A0A942T6Y7_9BACI